MKKSNQISKSNKSAYEPPEEKISNFQKVIDIILSAPESEQNRFIEEIVKWFTIKRHTDYTNSKNQYEIKSKMADELASNYKIAAEIIKEIESKR